MISDTGKGLNLVIRTQTSEDWEAFATWYSAWKNLPDAKVMIVCIRNDKVEFQYFQWAKRLQVPIVFVNQTSPDQSLDNLYLLLVASKHFNNNQTTLMVPSLAMFVDTLDAPTLEVVNSDFDLVVNPGVTLSKLYHPTMLQPEIENYELFGGVRCRTKEDTICWNVKENDPHCLVDYSKGCGNWIDTMKGCPFSNASGMVAETMTINEMRVIELWRKMVPLYSATN